MTLFMTELAVADFAASLAWYWDRLGLRVEVRDEPRRFALLAAPDGGRLALKGGEPTPGGVTVHFQVADLAAALARLAAAGVSPVSPVREDTEGYRRAVLADPDGYRVVVFEWVAGSG
ncbi:MAG: VOC family protein [Gemmataceae bacterium]